MFSGGVAVGNVQPYFLTQADVALDESKPLPEQPDLAAIEDQALKMGEVLADFISAATTSLDIAIYDFRLLDGAMTDQIVHAVQTAAGNGVSVRLAYDRTHAAGAILKEFADAGGDPAPTGTHTFIASAGLPVGIQVLPIQEEAINPGHQIMHQKYIVRDAGNPEAAVLMGSANFTTDAWGIQDNNVLVITEAPELAAAYEQDFAELWSTRQLASTGAGDAGSVTVGGIDIGYSFAPGEGTQTEDDITDVIRAATGRIRVASMVISSGKILQALADQIDRGLDVAGIYDGPQMANIAGE
jgi:phosphatidylserine/phosphatidylglycerophosphate/cardiolipin synthase-like enzyme